MSDNTDLISKEAQTDREELPLSKGGKPPWNIGSLKLFTCTANESTFPTSHTQINPTLVGQGCTFTTDRQIRATSLHKVLTVCNADKMSDHF